MSSSWSSTAPVRSTGEWRVRGERRLIVLIRSKPRRLLLLNDQLVCAAVSGRASEAGEAASLNLAGERLNVKWVAGLGEVELVEGNVGTLARLTVAGSVSSKRSSLGRSLTPASLHQSQGSESGQAENLAQDMADLMHDFDTVSR